MRAFSFSKIRALEPSLVLFAPQVPILELPQPPSFLQEAAQMF